MRRRSRHSAFGAAVARGLVLVLLVLPPAAAQDAAGLLEAADRSGELYRQGDLLGALPFAEEAARIAEAAFGPEDLMTATHMHNWSALSKVVQVQS